ncbi:trypsin [Candidatus Bathyarchaeota archaeon]|nr:MAG: trypsin [Candidatus Bathyarchaeota archaeon]
MEPESPIKVVVDRKPLYVMALVLVVLAGFLAYIYVDYVHLKSEYGDLLGRYDTLSSNIDSLQSIIESLYYNKVVSNLTAVKIYNESKYSIVLITCIVNGGERLGSGFVYRSDGYIITNNHVVEDASSITVTFLDGTVTDAYIVGRDVYSDLAVIKVNNMPEEAHPLILGNSSLLKVGEPVYAIGNPFGLSGSMTAGIVSQVGRVLRLSDFGIPPPQGNYVIADVVQFDAAVNPGNSGGPLLNSLGEVIGVTFAIETGGEVNAFIGIGYAISSDIVKRVVPDLIEKGHYDHPWMGIAYKSNYVGGVYIVSVQPGSPAESAGLQEGDIITMVDGHTIRFADDLVTYLEKYKSPGDTILLTVLRDTATLEIELTLGVRP